MMPVVLQVAEADSHVTVKRVRHSYRDRETHDAVCETQGIDVAIAQKEEAGDYTPHECDGSKDGVGQVSHRKDYCGHGDRDCLAGQEP